MPKDHPPIQAQLTCIAVRTDEQGLVLQITIQDITERKRAEDKLRQLSRSVEQSPASIVITDTVGNIEYINPKFTQITGYTLEEAIGANPRILKSGETAPEEYQRLWDSITRGGEWHGIFHNKKKNGELYWESAVLSAIKNEHCVITHFIAVKEDITERRRAEEAIRQSEAKYRALVEQAADGIFITDVQGRYLDVNASGCAMLGYTREEILGKDYTLILLPRDAAEDAPQLDLLRDGKILSRERLYRRKDGTLFPIEIRAKMLSDGRIQSIVRDITERKRAEEELREREASLRESQRVAHVGHWSWHTPTNQVVWSDEMKRIFGLDPATFDGNLNEIIARAIHPDDQAKINASNQAVMTEQRSAPLEYRIVLPDQSVRTVIAIPGDKVVDADGKIIKLTGIVQDITERKRAEAEIKKRGEQFALLYEAGLALNSSLNPQKLIEALLKTTQQAVDADRVSFFRFDPARNELGLENALGYDQEHEAKLREFHFPISGEAGLTSWVAQNRRPLSVPELTLESRYAQIDPALRSGIWIPILHNDRLLGVLTALSTQPGKLGTADENMLTLLANQMAIALDNGRLFQEAERNLRRVQSLRQIDRAMTSSMDLNLMLQTVLAQVVRQLGVDAADILALQPQTQTLEFVESIGFYTRALQHTHLRLGEGTAGKAALERKTIHIANLAQDEVGLAQLPLLRAENFVTYFGVPLITKGRVNGVLEIFHRAPLDPEEEWIEFLETLAGQAAIAIDNAELFTNLEQSNINLMLTYDTTLEGWSRALDLRDKETEGHSQRVTTMTLRLARAMGIDELELIHIRRGALLHDIGKMGVPDSILLKPDKLTPAEWETMQRHPDLAFRLLAPIAYLKPALDIPYCHHEKWDGTGYPRGLVGEQIPLSARIFAVADVWDALCSDRTYRLGWDKARARDYIHAEAGKHFDPRVVEEFLKLSEEDTDTL